MKYVCNNISFNKRMYGRPYKYRHSLTVFEMGFFFLETCITKTSICV